MSGFLFGFVDFIIEYLPDHEPGSQSSVAAVDGCFYGRTDLPSQSGMSGIERHWNYRKALLKMTVKMSGGKKMTS